MAVWDGYSKRLWRLFDVFNIYSCFILLFYSAISEVLLFLVVKNTPENRMNEKRILGCCNIFFSPVRLRA